MKSLLLLSLTTALFWNTTLNAQTVPTNFSSKLPILHLNTLGNNINSGNKENALLRIIDNISGVNTLTDSATYVGYVGIRPRGNYSSTLPQMPYSIDTWDTAQQNVDTSILGLPKEHDWVMMANYNDKSFYRNALANDLFTEMGHYAPRGKLVEVIVDNNYTGIYYFCEAIKRSKKRVKIAKLTAADTTGLELTGGYIWKNDFGDGWWSSFTPINYPLNVHYAYHYPSYANIKPQQEAYIQSVVNAAETALYDPNFAHPTNGFRKYLSLTSFYDYFIINELARNNDGFKKSVYFHKDIDSSTNKMSKIKMGPVWDFDWAWKNIDECVYGNTNGSEWVHQINQCFPDNTGFGWYERMLQDSSFANDLHCRYKQLRGTLLDTTKLFTWIDSAATVLDSAQMRHFATYQTLGFNSGAPENDSFPTTYIGEIAKFKQWIRTRILWLDANMFGNANNCGITTALSPYNKPSATVALFPNPANNSIFIESNTTIKQVQVITPTGISAHTYNIELLTTTQINVSQVPQGLCIIKILHANGSISNQKVTIIR